MIKFMLLMYNQPHFALCKSSAAKHSQVVRVVEYIRERQSVRVEAAAVGLAVDH